MLWLSHLSSVCNWLIRRLYLVLRPKGTEIYMSPCYIFRMRSFQFLLASIEALAWIVLPGISYWIGAHTYIWMRTNSIAIPVYMHMYAHSCYLHARPEKSGFNCVVSQRVDVLLSYALFLTCFSAAHSYRCLQLLCALMCNHVCPHVQSCALLLPDWNTSNSHICGLEVV